MYSRIIENRIREALSISPAVIMTGPRQAGKTTLALKLCHLGYTYVTLDDELDYTRAIRDPIGFIRNFDRVIIDEVQRAPELFRTIKKSIDDDRRKGRFLLTGSANVLLNPKMSDSLVGRMQRIELYPLSCCEIAGTKSTFLKRLYEGKLKNERTEFLDDDLIRQVLTGGFPEAIRMSEKERKTWTRSYLNFTLTRDLRDIAVVEKLTSLPNLIKKLSAYSGQLVNYSKLGSDIGINYHTVQRYLALLEQIYLIRILNPWHTNLLSRVSKTPKIHFIDTGLLSAASGLGLNHLKRNRDKFGYFLESFVFSEILKLMTASDMWLTPYHFRDKNMNEVDIVLERDDGMIAGIKVKATATLRPEDFNGLRILAEITGKMFAHGIILYDGTRCLPYGDNLTAVPLSSLWE